jgi:hypothetical protein
MTLSHGSAQYLADDVEHAPTDRLCGLVVCFASPVATRAGCGRLDAAQDDRRRLVRSTGAVRSNPYQEAAGRETVDRERGPLGRQPVPIAFSDRIVQLLLTADPAQAGGG